jgi:RecJ-like exonuclease
VSDDNREGVALCPECDGAGSDDDARTCERCQGNGEIVVDWALYLGCSPEDAAKIDAAWKRHEAAGPK